MMSRAITHETRKTSGLAVGRWGRGSPGRYLSNSLVSIQESPPLNFWGTPWRAHDYGSTLGRPASELGRL